MVDSLRATAMSSTTQAVSYCRGYTPRAGSLAVGCCYLLIGTGASLAILHASIALEQSEDSSEEENDGEQFVLTAALLEAITRALMSVFLIYGVHKEKKSYLLLWMIVNGMCLFSTLLWMLLFMVMATLLGEEWLIGFGISGADAALRGYFLLVVHSYRKLLLECSTGVVGL